MNDSITVMPVDFAENPPLWIIHYQWYSERGAWTDENFQGHAVSAEAALNLARQHIFDATYRVIAVELDDEGDLL